MHLAFFLNKREKPAGRKCDTNQASTGNQTRNGKNNLAFAKVKSTMKNFKIWGNVKDGGCECYNNF